jgi:hypothetical protein
VVGAEVRPARPGEGARLGEIFLASGRAAWAGHLPAEGLAKVGSPKQDLEDDESSGWTLDGAHREKTFAGATYTEVRYRIEISPGTGSRPVT